MPWEKSFDESEVIEQVMRLFWEKGYAATSISDITEATGIKRGSLYNAFDGKDELFLRALLKYDNELRKSMLSRLEAVEDAREAIAMFFDYCVKGSLDDPERKGCLLVNTALDFTHHDDEVRRIVADAFEEIVTFFESTIRRGQADGVIPDSVEPRSTARTLMALISGIRVLGRGVFGKSALNQIGREAQRLISR